MIKNFILMLGAAAAVAGAVVARADAGGAQDVWELGEANVWARGRDAITLSKNGAVLTVTHTGGEDWSLYGFPRVETKAGELFELEGRVRLENAAHGAAVAVAVTLRDAEGGVLSWSYGAAELRSAGGEWVELRSRFIVPAGGASVEQRLIGHGALVVHAEGMRLRRDKAGARAPNPARLGAFESRRGGVALAYDGAAGALEISREGAERVWRMPIEGRGWMILDAEASADGGGFTVTALNTESVREARALFALSADGELRVEVDSPAGAMPKPLEFPPPFESRRGDRLVVPMNEGISYPVDEEHQELWRMVAYGGHGLCMGFFGAMEDASGAGWMCILETPDDASMAVRQSQDADAGAASAAASGVGAASASAPAQKLWQAWPAWDAQRGEFGYTRKARYVLFASGGHVAMCKRYREHAKASGLFMPFTEKVKRRPKIDLLIGAANIWNWDANERKPELVAELQAAGIDRILWSSGGSAETLKALNAMTNVLTSRYDIYQDIMDPARHGELDYVHGDWVTEAFPHDINIATPAGDWRRGWTVRAKDGTMIPCAVICDARALPYARARISAELQTKPYAARFIDTTVAAPWFECYAPAHPMTRAQSRAHKMSLLNLVSEEFGLICGSETGHEAAVPFCDYFEGMLSLCNYRVPESGRDMWKVWDDVPPLLAKYQVGEAYRLPLWELVYHDCVVAQWYWGDYNNKLPKLWRKRDLFNALYGTPPMYMFGVKQWAEFKDQFAASYKTAAPIARATGYHEMTDHRILTPDRAVQRTTFANGVTVTVNFGDAPWRDETGAEIPALDLRVTGM